MISPWPKAIELLLCSAPSGAGVRSWPAASRRSDRSGTPSRLPDLPATRRRRRISSSSALATAGSSAPSTSSTSPSPPPDHRDRIVVRGIVDPPRRQRQHVGLGLPVRQLDVDQAQVAHRLAPAAAQPHGVADGDPADLARFGGEPALAGQVLGQRLLELRPAPPLEHARPAVGAADRGRRRRRVARPRLGYVQREPEEARAGRASAGTAARPTAAGTRCARTARPAPGRPDARRSSSTYWANRDRFATTRIRSSSYSRTKASTLRFSGCRNSIAPRRRPCGACAGAISRFIHHSSELGCCCCASTLTALVVVLGVDDHRQVQPLRVGPREAGVAVGAPLHRRAHAVAVAEVDVVAHADLVAVVDDRRARQRRTAARSSARSRRRSLPSSGASRRRMPRLIRACGSLGVRRGTCSRAPRRSPSRASARRGCAGRWPTGSPRGSAASGRRMSMIGIAVLHPHGHEHPRHQREVEGHVALVAVAEVGDGVLGPLVGLGQQHAVRVTARRRGAAAPSGTACVSGRFSQFVPSRSYR